MSIVSHKAKAENMFRMVVNNFFEKGMPIGFSISEMQDWNGQIAFKDIMKLSRPFRIVAADRPIGFWNGFNTRQLPLSWFDADGYPKQVPYTPPGWGVPVRPVTFINTKRDIFPTGLYTLRFEGKGRIALSGMSEEHLVDGNGGTTEYKFLIPPDNTGIYLDITASSLGDHIRNIQLILPGYGNDDLIAYPFYPPFIKKLKGAPVLRFFGDSGNRHLDDFPTKPIVKWLERKKTTFRTQAGIGSSSWQGCGLALEYIVQLCNQANSDLWLCTGHQWNDDFLRKAAALIKSSLNKNLRVWVEYSNETWNSNYISCSYARSAAVKKALSGETGNSEHQWAVHRSINTWDIFADAFKGHDRIIKVLGVCYQDYSLTQERIKYAGSLSCNPNSVKVDVLGLSPLIKLGEISESHSISDIHEKCRKGIEDLDKNIDAFVHLARNAGCSVVCYEGGLDVSPVDSESFETVKTAFRDKEMYHIYMEYLKMLERHGISLFMHIHTSLWSFHGLWGALEYTDEPVSQQPRYMAMRDFAGY